MCAEVGARKRTDDHEQQSFGAAGLDRGFNQPGAKATWRLTRADAVVGVTRIGLGELARFGPTPERVGQLDAFLRDQTAAIEAAKPWDIEIFGVGLRKALGG